MSVRNPAAGMALLCVFALAAAAPAPNGKWPGPQGDTYASIARLPDWSGTWAMADSAFVEFMKSSAKAPFRPGYVAQHHPQRSNSTRCLPAGMPAIMTLPLGHEFLFTPRQVTILTEEGPLIRRVYTDGRAHSDDPDPTYAGESIGHWEGGTLVIDTVGISAKSEFLNMVKTSGKAHVTERIRLLDATHMQVDMWIEDPVALTQPWDLTIHYQRSGTGFLESYYCDNDRDANGEPDLRLTAPAEASH